MPERLKGRIAVQTTNAAHHLIRPPSRWGAFAICTLLALAVWIIYGQTLRHKFVNYDNAMYVYENPDISQGLSWRGILWAFTHVHVDEWWPLTSISHMLDCELFGLNPAGHHLTNVLLHGATAILLFLLFRSMTGTFWRSAFVAALFAIHPLRVESVAWMTERKDVLSGLFFVLTLGTYVRYVRHGRRTEVTGRRSGIRSSVSAIRFLTAGTYWLTLLFFALGLLSKATLVTMPFVLLLLDYWPLQKVPGVRTQVSRADTFASDLTRCISHLALLVEKIPFLLLAIASSVTTFLAVGEVHPIAQLSIGWRIANALVAYATYLKQLFYPVGLAVFYPHPEDSLPLWAVGLSVVALAIISAGVIAGFRRRPYLLVGWLWYLGMLVPVIGLLQVGSQARADRYTYLPQIGLYLLVAWAVAEWCGARRCRRAVLGAVATLFVTGLMVRAHDQTKHWRDDVSLWTHTLSCTSGNYVGHHNLGATLADQGKLDQAILHYRQALEIKPNYAEAQYNWGVALTRQGKGSEAIPHYERALQLRPDYANAHINLGNALAGQGQLTGAIQHYEQAIQLKPGWAEAHFNLGNALAKQGRLDEAIRHYRLAVQLKPDYAEAHYNLGNRLAAQGRVDEAILCYEKTIRIKPNYAGAHNNLGNRLAAQRKWAQAVQHYRQALQLKPDDAEAHNNLGVALVNQNRVEEAIACYEQALRIEPDYAQAHANLGSALGVRGETNNAIQHLQRALELATTQTNTAFVEAVSARLRSYQSRAAQSNTP